MKITVVKLKAAVFITLVAWSINGFAQIKTTMSVMKNGAVVYESLVSDSIQVTFDGALRDTLFVQKNDGSPVDMIRLNNIQQLSFSDVNLSVATSSGSETYAFDNIAKLLFRSISATGINNPVVQGGVDVRVSVTPAGEVTVESSAAIRSLALFSVDGKMIAMEKCNATFVETLHATSLRANAPAGIYLLRIETAQGTIVKKIVKPVNK